MPPRWLCIAIVLAWLGSTGPLVWKELRPLFDANPPPPFHIDLVDEAQGDKHKIRWSVHVGKDEPPTMPRAPWADSWVSYHEADDTFSFHTEMKASHSGPIPFGPVGVRTMNSSMRLDRGGRHLREMHVLIEFDAFGAERIVLNLDGTVENGALTPVVVVRPPFLPPITLPAPTVRLPEQAVVMLPLHLVNRIRGLHPGQTWRMPMLDPVKTSMNFTGGQKAELVWIDARVLPDIRELPRHPGVECYVIEYDTETRPLTWVQIGTDFVVRQEAHYEETRIVLQRFNVQPVR